MAIEDTVYEGKDLAEAIRSASSALGIPEGDLHYEIVEQGRRGVFGLGAKSVLIRVKPPLEEPPANAIEAIEAINVADPEESGAPAETGGKNGDRRSKRRRRRRRSGGDDRPGTTASRTVAPAPEPGEQPEAAATTVSDENLAAVDGTVRKMVELMGLDLTTRSTANDGGVSIELEGADGKMLMDRNAELLMSIQFLLNRMARRAWPDVRRVHLQCDGKRSQRRDDDLVELVREVAQQVTRTGRTKRLEPMNAYERRLVHITVREYSGLTSSSDGNGSMKRVRISKVKNEI